MTGLFRKPVLNPNMSRTDRIRAEIAAAAEFGLTPPASIPLQENFRVNRVTRGPSARRESTIPSSVLQLNDADFTLGLSDHSGSLAGAAIDRVPNGRAALEQLVDTDIERLDATNWATVMPALNGRLQAIQAFGATTRALAALQSKIGKAIFGKVDFKKHTVDDLGGSVKTEE